MKHTLAVTLFLIIVFFLAQVVGLAVVNAYIDHVADEEVVFKQLPYNMERPPVEEGTSFIFILVAILIGTIIILLLIRFKKRVLWKTWFLLAVIMTLAIAFTPFIGGTLAFVLAAILGGLKVFKPSIIIHNFTELFIYGGLAAIFVPIMNVFAGVMLLIFISLYDMYAVWKSKHMIKMAQFQASTNVFAGLYLPYKGKPQKKGKKVEMGMLGGGDIGFPLIFAGILMKDLMLTNPVGLGFLKALIIPVFATLALSWLFFRSKKGRFYPAMPFLSIGCFLGYGVLLLIGL